jgi:hypothetical protein
MLLQVRIVTIRVLTQAIPSQKTFLDKQPQVAIDRAFTNMRIPFAGILIDFIRRWMAMITANQLKNKLALLGVSHHSHLTSFSSRWESLESLITFSSYNPAAFASLLVKKI